ncbi:MAG TPA: hypothetical protein VGP72_31390 [Planctomycetota bacterium]
MSKGSFAAALAVDGLQNETMTSRLAVPVTVIFNGQQLRKTVPQRYTAVKGQSGTTK